MNKYTEIYVDDRIEKIISIANKVDLSNSVNDLFAGISGMIRVLTEFDDIWKLKGAKELSDKLAILLMNNKTEVRRNKKLWITLHDKNIISGTAHGQSGIASALISYGNRVGNQKCVEAALDAIEYECSIYSEKLCGWPDLRSDNQGNVVHGYCSGEAGIGINSLNYIDKYSELNLKRAISLCLHEKDGYCDHLCCGNCSRIEFLLEAGERLGDEKLSRQAKINISRIVLKSKKTGGYNFLDEKYEKVFSPTLFFGAAGVGYELLRCSSPSMIDTLFL